MRSHAKAPAAAPTRTIAGTCALLVCLLCVLGISASTASAAPPTVTTDPASEVGVTSARATGKVNPEGKETNYRFEYVSDQSFQAKDAEQRLLILATAGTYTLSFQGQTTDPIAFDASPAVVETELNALSSIGGAGGSVAVTGGPGDEKGTTPYFLTFGGSLAETDVEALGVDYTNLLDDPQYGPYGVAETLVTGHPEGFALAGQAGNGTLGEAEPETPVETVLEGLAPGTEYHLRLVAENADGTQSAVASTFTTEAITDPTVAIDPASGVGYTKAHISGSIDPEGGNFNPIGGPVAIGWELQYSPNPAEFGWWGFFWGTIEGSEAESDSPIAVEADLEGIANNTEYQYRLVAYYAGKEAISPAESFTTDLVTKPMLEVDDASSVTGQTAHFSGEVTAGEDDPAFDSSCFFDFVPDAQFQIDGYGSARTVACDPDPVKGTSATAVEADPTGLLPGTLYHLRLRAENQGGQETDEVTFTTAAIAPQVAGVSASDVTSTEATLRAQVNPGGASTTFHFDYMTLAAFEAAGETFAGATSTPESAPIGADAAFHAVAEDLGGLQPGTPYRFRVVATNAKGSSTSGPSSLTTAGSAEDCPNAAERAQQSSTYLPECRSYELVNKPGLDLGEANRMPWIRDDGEWVSYASAIPADDAQGAGILSAYVAHRTADGWVSTNADPKSVGPTFGTTTAENLARIFTPDFSAGLFSSTQPLDPDDLNGNQDFYRVEVGTGASTWMTNANNYPTIGEVSGVTPDLQRVVFRKSTYGDNEGLYASDGTDLEYLSFRPDGSPFANAFVRVAGPIYTRGLNTGNDVSGAFVEHGGAHGVSEDAKRVYFQYDVNDFLYLRDLTGSTPKTVPVGVSELPGEVGVQKAAYFISATADGSSAYIAAPYRLTEDSTPGGGIYRFDVATETLTQITPPGDPTGMNVRAGIASADQSRLYFISNSALAPGAVGGQYNAYVWSEANGTRLVAAGISADDRVERVSQDGRYALLTTSRSIDGAPNAGHAAIYEYDDVSGDLNCISCRQDGSSSQGDAYLRLQSFGQPIANATDPRNITDDGRVFFISTDKLLPADQTSAGDVYVYDRGSLGLISSGDTKETTFLGENSDDGKHVFIITRAALSGADRDAAEFDIYDANVDGGFLEPPPPPAICEGEACRDAGSNQPAGAGTPTRTFVGPGDPTPKPKCKKGKVRRHGKCVRKSHHKNKQKRPVHRDGRTGR